MKEELHSWNYYDFTNAIYIITIYIIKETLSLWLKIIIFSKGNCLYMFSYYSNLTKNSLTGYKIILGFVNIYLILENRAFLRTWPIFTNLKQILESLNICAAVMNCIFCGHTDRPKFVPPCTIPALSNLPSVMFGQERQTAAKR